jgi:hypothetical protein
MTVLSDIIGKTGYTRIGSIRRLFLFRYSAMLLCRATETDHLRKN